MTITEINQLRKQGRLQEALREVELLRADNPKDIWVARSAAWVYLDLIKQYAQQTDISQIINFVQKLIDLQLPENENAIFNRLIWNIQTFLSSACNTDIPLALFRQLLDQLSHLPFDKQDDSYSALLNTAVRIQDTQIVLYFIKWWNLDNLRPEDFLPREYNGEQQMPLAEKAYYAQCKGILSTNNSNIITHYLPILSQRAEQHKHYKYLPYYQARMLLLTGEAQKAKEILKPFARQNDNAFWVWQLLGDMHEQPAEKTPFYCKALLCKSPNTMLVKMWTNIGVFFINNGHPQLGKNLIENAIQTYHGNGWHLPYLIQQIANTSMYQQTQPLFDKNFVTAQSLEAEQYLYGEMKTYTVMVMHFNSEKQMVVCLTEQLQRIIFYLPRNNKTTYREGDLLTITTNEIKDGGKIKVRKIEIIKGTDNDCFYKTFEGRIHLSVSGYGIVKDVFIPLQIAKDQPDKQIVKGRAIRSYNKSKNTYGWRAVEIHN